MHMLYDSDSFVVVHMQANAPAEGEPDENGHAQHHHGGGQVHRQPARAGLG